MIAFFLALFVACNDSAPEAPTPVVPEEVEPAAPPEPVASVPRVLPTTDERFAARHILVAFSGGVSTLTGARRSREEAQVRIEEAKARIDAGADFGEIAKAYSDDSTGPRGGDLGGFDQGTMVKPFEDALRTLAPGQVSGIVETPFGFHLIKREPLREIHGAHLMIAWKGAEKAGPEVTRSKEEAAALAAQALAAIQAGKDWGSAVRAWSDTPLKEDAGDLGWFGPKQLAPQLDKAAFDLDVGAVSAVIETPRGYHLIKRLE